MSTHCCRSGMFMPYPGYEFFHPRPRILDPGQKRSLTPGSRSTSKNWTILPKNTVSKLSERWSWMYTPPPPIQDPGFRGQKSTGSRIWICNSGSTPLLDARVKDGIRLCVRYRIKLSLIRIFNVEYLYNKIRSTDSEEHFPDTKTVRPILQMSSGHLYQLWRHIRLKNEISEMNWIFFTAWWPDIV